MIKTCNAVIFDLGRVLIDYDWHIALKGLRKWTALEPEEAERRILAKDGVFQFETGHLTERAFHAHVEEAIEARVPFDEFEGLWNSIFTGEIVPVARVARGVVAEGKVKFAILSNTNEMHVRFLRRTWSLLNELPNVFLSNEIRLRKPNPEALQFVLDRMGTTACDTLFVDDLPENIATAQRMGFQTIRVTGPEQAVRALKDYGFYANGNGKDG
jgi:putative hydrolase of the HAD superfamily